MGRITMPLIFQLLGNDIKYLFRKPYERFIHRIKSDRLFEQKYQSIRDPKTLLEEAIYWPPQQIFDDLVKNGIDAVPYEVDPKEFKEFSQKSGFPIGYGAYTGGHLIEKSLEHFLSAKFLGLSKEDVYIDIANCHSLVPRLYSRLYGCKSYKQDLIYPAGIHADTIGGDAAEMPVKDGFATKMAMHCSFEHFEQDADIKFIKEAGRVLRVGGKLCIVPLYLAATYRILTDPVALEKPNFEDQTCVCAVKNWRQTHGRFYDTAHLISRIKANLGPLKLKIYYLTNIKKINPTCYAHFIALFERT